MAYDEVLAERVRELLVAEEDVAEQRMFGGLAFLVRGNMAVAASSRGGLMVRVDPSEGDSLVATTAAEPMEMRGRPMRGWLHLGGASVQTDQQLAEWVTRGSRCARSLPAKAPRRPRR